jgi:hypothetical protein
MILVEHPEQGWRRCVGCFFRQLSYEILELPLIYCLKQGFVVERWLEGVAECGQGWLFCRGWQYYLGSGMVVELCEELYQL